MDGTVDTSSFAEEHEVTLEVPASAVAAVRSLLQSPPPSFPALDADLPLTKTASRSELYLFLATADGTHHRVTLRRKGSRVAGKVRRKAWVERDGRWAKVEGPATVIDGSAGAAAYLATSGDPVVACFVKHKTAAIYGDRDVEIRLDEIVPFDPRAAAPAGPPSWDLEVEWTGAHVAAGVAGVVTGPWSGPASSTLRALAPIVVSKADRGLLDPPLPCAALASPGAITSLVDAAFA